MFVFNFYIEQVVSKSPTTPNGRVHIRALLHAFNVHVSRLSFSTPASVLGVEPRFKKEWRLDVNDVLMTDNWR